ncbi:MAG: tRNA (adenosine(37)-N6)-dimethylallyltransferase MiaA [Candidatus Omnitrophota bacterium]|nr:MAG: tRNA (adenosine(37)-N6)-dimethylallyltransferase MiaA [Candidatus Omnitrophota bacterium]
MAEVIFIVGPTATGKTETSFLLAKHIKGEIISCDSMLFYKEPRIIVSHPPDYMLEEIPHHFVSTISVKDTYNVFDYYCGAAQKIEELYKNNITVIVCGGSGLYVRALLDGIFVGAGKDEQLRKRLEEKARIGGNEALFKELQKLDPDASEKISPNDTRRIVRALEVYFSSGLPISKQQKKAEGLYKKLPIRIFGLRLSRVRLYQRINKRTEEMFAEGAVAEVKELLKYDLSLTAEKIIGIKEIRGYLDGKYDLDTAKEIMKRNTRRFAKRQITWFKKDKRIEWIDIDGFSAEDIKNDILRRIEYK